MTRAPTASGIVALGDDRETALEIGRQIVRSGLAPSATVYVAREGWDRKFVSVLRVEGPVASTERGRASALPRRLLAIVEPAGAHGLYEAELRQVKHHGRTFGTDEPSPGVSMVFGIWRHAQLDHDAFDAHWRDVHAPLAVQHHVGMWAYTQCSFRRALAGHSVDYDGLAICQFPSLEDLHSRFYGSPEGERAIGEDVVQFGDPTRLDRVQMTEFVFA